MKITSSLNDPAIFSPSFQRRSFDGPVKDPCDYVLKFGGEAFQSLINNARHAIDYKFDCLVSECIQADPNAHAEAIEKAVAWFAVYIHARTDLDPDHPAIITPYKRGAIYCRLSRLSGLTVEEVRRLIEWNEKKLPPHPKPTGFPRLADEKRDAALEQLEHLEELAREEEADRLSRGIDDDGGRGDSFGHGGKL